MASSQARADAFYDLSGQALRFGHALTLNMLLREERATWHVPRLVISGSTREIFRGITWFHKVLLLAANEHEKHKDNASRQAELKEFLQGWLQEFKDVLNHHTRIHKTMYSSKLRRFFLAGSEHTPCALAFIQSASGSSISLGDSKDAEVAMLVETYGLHAEALLERKKRIERLAAGDINEAERPLLKEYLKVRLTLGALVYDPILIGECLGSFSKFQMECFAEVLFDLISMDNINVIYPLIQLLTKEQAKAFIDYWFEEMSPIHFTDYLKTKNPSLGPSSLKFIFDAIAIIRERTGDYREQINYLYAAFEARFPEEEFKSGGARFIMNVATHFTWRVGIYQPPESLPLCKDTLPKAISDELENYPLLVSHFCGKLSDLHHHIVRKSDNINTWSDIQLETFCKDFWADYLFTMWIEFNYLPLHTIKHQFQYLDYWLENLLKNQAKFPRLYAQMIETLVSADYFSGKVMAYYFKYRIGDERVVAKRIQVIEKLRKSKALPEFVDTEASSLLSNTSYSLLKKIDAGLESRKDSIYAQLDFMMQALDVAVSKHIEADSARPGIFKYMLDYLFNRTPLAYLLKQYGVDLTGIDLSTIGLDDLLMSVEDEAHFADFNYSVFIEKLSFNKDSARATLLLFLFLFRYEPRTTTHKALLNFIGNVFLEIATEFDHGLEKSESFSIFFDELAQHGFFKSETDSTLYYIFYCRFFMLPDATNVKDVDLGAAGAGEVLVESKAPVIELEVLPDDLDVVSDKAEAVIKAKKRRKAKRPATDAPSLIDSTVLAGAGDAAVTPALIDERSSTPSSSTLSSSVPSPLPDVLEDSVVALPESSALVELRKLRQALSALLKPLAIRVKEKLATYPEDSLQYLQYQRLLESLVNSQDNAIALRKLLKDISAKEKVKDSATLAKANDTPTSELTFFEQLQQYQVLVEKMSEHAIAVEGGHAVIKLVENLKDLTLEKMLHPFLYERLKLPVMPIVKQLAALFSEYAVLQVYGSSLFLENPLDIDLRLIWKDPDADIETLKKNFKSIIEDAGFELAGTPRDIIGGSSITLKAKGDGYGLDDYKSISVTLLVANPALRLALMHYTSHSAAAIDFSTGFINCDFAWAQDVITGIFSIQASLFFEPAPPVKEFDPGFSARVHVLTILMRVWFAAQSGSTTLHSSAQDLIDKIEKHKGNWLSLEAEDWRLASALQGMITRHFSHYQAGADYHKRTQIFLGFLKMLGVTSIENCAANAVKDLITYDLSLYKPSTTSLLKTEAFLVYCRECSLPVSSLKAILNTMLSRHFGAFVEGNDYLGKTVLLLDFCRQRGFRLLSLDIADKKQGQIVDAIDVTSKTIHFSATVPVTDSDLLFTADLRYLTANHTAIIQERVRQKLSEHSATSVSLSKASARSDHSTSSKIMEPVRSQSAFFPVIPTTGSGPGSAVPGYSERSGKKY